MVSGFPACQPDRGWTGPSFSISHKAGSFLDPKLSLSQQIEFEQVFIVSISTYNLLTSVWYWSLRTSASDCPFFSLMCRPHSKTGLAWVYLPYITVRQGSQASKPGSCNSLSFSPPFLPFTSHPHNDTYGSYMVHIWHIYDTYMIHMGHDWVTPPAGKAEKYRVIFSNNSL